MATPTTEQFAQRLFDLNLLTSTQLDAVWGEFGTREVPLESFQDLLLRRELLTNFQIERVLRGERSGYYYGPYKVLYLVASGTFARVYRSVDPENGRVVAVKVLRKRFSEDREKTDQFLREGELGKSLRHPSIVPIYDVHSSRGQHYIVMEFIEGQNLRDFVRIRRRLAPAEALGLIADVLAGLDFAGQKGITHRDLKLTNILVTSRGKAKLVDFGLAGARTSLSEEALDACDNPRTIDYAALARAPGARTDDPRSDIYFVGCILYHMLAGQAPLMETKDRIQRLSITRFQDITPITKLIPDLPVQVAMVVSKAMELVPERRYPSPGNMLSDVKFTIKRLEAGDVGTLEGAESEDNAANELEGVSRTIMLIESNVDMQNKLRDRLKRHGYRVLVISDPDRALARLREEGPPAADCAVFCAHELGDTAVKAFKDLAVSARTRHIPAVLLLSTQQQDWAEGLPIDDLHAALAIPFRLNQFRALLRKLISRPAESA